MQRTILDNSSNSPKNTTFKMCRPVRDKRTQMFYARVAVPVNLRSILGKRELKKSLRTKDNREALLRFPGIYQQFLNIIELAKKQLFGMQQSCANDFQTLSTEFADNGFIHSQTSKLTADVTEPPMLNLVNTIGAQNPNSDNAYQAIVRNTGDSTQYKLSAYFERYKRNQIETSQGSKDAVTRTVNDYATTVKRFIKVIGDLDIRMITKEQISIYRDTVLKLPARPKLAIRALPIDEQIMLAERCGLPTVSPSTVKTGIRGLSSVLQSAVENGIIDINPAHGVTKVLTKRKKKVESDDKGYTDEQLSIIFGSDCFKLDFKLPRADYGAAWFWLPILMYYTGARVEELAQSYAKDVQQADGVYFISLNEDSDDKSLKGVASLRKVPLHKDLIEIGFLKFVDSLDKNSRLFTKLKRGSNGKYSTSIGKRIGKYYRNELKILGIDKPCHDFRHCFKTKARNAGISEEISDCITGHTNGSVGRNYGKYSINLLSDAINKIPSLPYINNLKFNNPSKVLS